MKNYRVELKWSFIYIFMTLIWALIGKLLGFHAGRIANNLIFNILIIIPSFITYLLATLEKRNLYYQGTMTYRQGLISGLILTVLVTILGPLTPLISIGLISPELFENLIQFAVSSKLMSKTEAVKQFNTPTFIIQGLIAAPIFGLIFSLITAAFVYKSNR
jgi:hypothetical protein